MDAYTATILSNIGMISFVALSAYILLVTGEISFGQQAFFGIGAYAAGIATTMWGQSLWTGLLIGGLCGATAAAIVGALTLRLSGLYFAIATLAFAEMMRLWLLTFRYQVDVDGDRVGPNGEEGFHDIRWIFENDITTQQYMWIIFAILGLALACLFCIEQTRLGAIFRMLGQDDLLTEMQGLNRVFYKVVAAGLAGFVAAIGGGLYAHAFTYVEPQNFNVMLGVHALAYGLIGGLGTVFGPLIGVAIDIGFLEAIRAIQGYRMIVFGGLVAVLLIFMPRGILDEDRIHRLKRWLTRRSDA